MKLEELNINPESVCELLVDFITEETGKVGFKRAIVGLSGGLDSSAVTYLLAKAMGARNVIAVFMPYKTSSPESRKHAELVMKRTRVKNYHVDITPMVDAYFEKFPDADRNRQGNKMARERMSILYDLSASEEALVIGTSNKSELLLGYGTLYGDVACAINPIGDLYKTQVTQLAAFLEVPQEIIKKAPTADLWVGQTDEGELGFTYEEVDRLLYYMVDRRKSISQLVKLGFKRTFAERVEKVVRLNQFTRSLPIIAKVSHRTVGIDFRYPRDWGV